MHLFHASSLFAENANHDILSIIKSPDKLRDRIIEVKKKLLQLYHFKAYHVPEGH